MKIKVYAIGTVLLLSSSQSFAQPTGDLPTTEQFVSLLTTCAAGSGIQISGELQGSFQSIYQGIVTNADDFRLITSADFLDSLPPEDQLEGYRLYQECVLSILTRNTSEKDEIPNVIELPTELVTFGEPLEIRAKTVIASESVIRAFPTGTRAAPGNDGANGPNGANGANGSGGAGGDGHAGGAATSGQDGDAAGPVTIIAENFVGSLTIFNNGMAGGPGGAGGAGGNGGYGGQGSSSVSGLFDCSSGPGNGGPGGSAGGGGDAGRGGDGGSGGVVTIRFDKVATGSTLTITSLGGVEGQSGAPGRAGQPGIGGPRGNTGGNCGGGGRTKGADGVPAPNGRALGGGQPGIDGQIEVVIGTETFVGTKEFTRGF